MKIIAMMILLTSCSRDITVGTENPCNTILRVEANHEDYNCVLKSKTFYCPTMKSGKATIEIVSKGE